MIQNPKIGSRHVSSKIRNQCTGEHVLPKAEPRGGGAQWIAYFRVSTDRQGVSGLGLDAQRDAVERYVNQVGGNLIAAYTEVESGKSHKNRPQLQAALDECRKRKARLVIAKLDRLARNVAFIANLMEAGVEFRAVDMPEASKLLLHMMAAFAEHERDTISQRTRAALAAARARGVKLGTTGKCRAQENQRAADAFAESLADKFDELRARGVTGNEALARALNAEGVPAFGGGRWHRATVRKLILRLGALDRRQRVQS